MTLVQLLTLAIVQGITEFLPISSSAHLILAPRFFGWPDQGLLLDIAVHVGALGAVCLYFWRDLWKMAAAVLAWRGGPLLDDPDRRLAFMVVGATIPILIAGLLMKLALGDNLRSMEVIGWAMLGFGLVLWAADKWAPPRAPLERLTWRDALLIGLAQCIALIPGASRAGVTMTAARALGYDRIGAARFSMLLSIPTILAAGALVGLDLVDSDAAIGQDVLIATALAFASALAAIHLLMKWLQHASFTPFVIYRVVLGGFLLYLVYFT